MKAAHGSWQGVMVGRAEEEVLHTFGIAEIGHGGVGGEQDRQAEPLLLEPPERPDDQPVVLPRGMGGVGAGIEEEGAVPQVPVFGHREVGRFSGLFLLPVLELAAHIGVGGAVAGRSAVNREMSL